MNGAGEVGSGHSATPLARTNACSFSSTGHDEAMSPFKNSSSGKLGKRFASAMVNRSSLGESRKREASSSGLKRFRSAKALLKIRRIEIRWREKVIMLKEGHVECTTDMLWVQHGMIETSRKATYSISLS